MFVLDPATLHIDGCCGGWCWRKVVLEVVGIISFRCCRGHGVWKAVLRTGNGVSIRIGQSLWFRLSFWKRMVLTIGLRGLVSVVDNLNFALSPAEIVIRPPRFLSTRHILVVQEALRPLLQLWQLVACRALGHLI